MECARANIMWLEVAGDEANDGRGDHTGWARESDGIGDNMDATELMESDRNGAPIFSGGGYDSIVDALDPMESDRNGAALAKWGNEMTDNVPPAVDVESWRDMMLATEERTSSLEKTM
mmetsp:Transcript_11335/g.24182  ORF Transcript_11335/g.24182 Transcript_11335/m.24182 type:complete len:118 (-) Transcript_11335:821-1174(-)